MTIIVSASATIATLAGDAVSAQSIIDDAVDLLGELEDGESVGGTEATRALSVLNNLLDALRNEKLMAVSMQEETLALDGSSSYSIGPSGDLNTNRPVRIESAYVLDGVISYPGIRVIEDGEYDAIPDKTSTSSWPTRINYRPTSPTGTLYTYPLATGVDLVLMTWTPLLTFATVSTQTTLAPGWRRMLASNLALDLAPRYEVEPRQSVVKMAMESKASIKRINSRPIKAYTELARLLGQRRSNILTDQP